MRPRPPMLLALLWIFRTDALHVAKGSPCEKLCGNVLDATTAADVVCDQGAYSTTSGAVFQQCVSCELSSPYHNSIQTDMQWLMYNLRFATSYCLFGYLGTDIKSSPCLTSTACEPLVNAVEYNSLAPNSSAYGYCSLWDAAHAPRCMSCLRLSNEQYLANFLTILQAGCDQQPAPGSTVSVEGNPFSVVEVNITEPTPTATGFHEYNSGPLSLGAKVGIAVGAALLILASTGCCIVWNGKRKRRAFLKTLVTKQGHSGWPTPINTHNLTNTPLSQKPLRGWDDSPMTAHTEKTFPRYFSPYSSQYNSPVSAVEDPRLPWPVDNYEPQSPPHEIGIALGGDSPADRWQDNKGKHPDEAYEMREVDGPYEDLNQRRHNFGQGMPYQPAYGVHPEYNPAAYQGLTEEDARRGHAL